jgi:c-di-GMP-binding flagellar brake protein YcgR
MMARKMLPGTVLFMAMDPRNRLPAFVDEIPEKPIAIERRKRARAPVHWPLCFARQGTADLVRTTTHDLSSHGFYCIANAGFVPGELRECTLVVPTHHPNGGRPALPILCKVRVVRVEVLGESGFCGVGCEIEDYRFLGSAGDSDGEWLTEATTSIVNT